jgi:hypothetical protein
LGSVNHELMLRAGSFTKCREIYEARGRNHSECRHCAEAIESAHDEALVDNIFRRLRPVVDFDLVA